MSPLTRSTRRLLVARSIEVLLILLGIVGFVVGYPRVLSVRENMLRQRIEFEQAPTSVAEQFEAKRDLERLEPVLQRFRGLVIHKENIGESIAIVETIARQYKVAVQVPELHEVVVFDEAGQPIPPAGPFTEIDLTLRAEGRPEDLLRFVHAIEHVPYLMSLSEWSVEVNRVPTRTRILPPGRDALEEPASNAPTVSVPAELTAHVIVTAHRDE